jgi:nitrogen PTS system EIIA component
MISIPTVLKSSHIDLSLSASDPGSAVKSLLELLRGDLRVMKWDEFSQAVMVRDASPITAHGCGILIAHGRTNSVGSLVMAAGVSPAGIPFPSISTDANPIHLVFVAGIPAAFSNDYLRVVGTIARLCSKEALLASLRKADSPATFLSLLSQEEDRL